MKSFARTICLLVALAIALPGCATRQGQDGAVLGGLVGAVAGGLLDRGNGWRGAVIGGGLGAILGGGLGEMIGQASQEAQRSGRPVYRDYDDGYRSESYPYWQDDRGQRTTRRPQRHERRCADVNERVYDSRGQLVSDEWKRICP